MRMNVRTEQSFAAISGADAELSARWWNVLEDESSGERHRALGRRPDAHSGFGSLALARCAPLRAMVCGT
jgi:hypothetical protein